MNKKQDKLVCNLLVPEPDVRVENFKGPIESATTLISVAMQFSIRHHIMTWGVMPYKLFGISVMLE